MKIVTLLFSTVLVSGQGLLIDPYRFGAAPDPSAISLTNSLTGYFKLDEASGNRASQVLSATLTDNNSVLAATGLVVDAALFEASNSEYFTSASLFWSDDFTLAFWVYPETLSVNQYLWNQGWGGAIADQSGVYIDTSNRPNFWVSNGLGGGTYNIVTSSTTLSLNTWAFIVVQHDDAGNTVGISVNGGAFQTVATTIEPTFTGANQFVARYGHASNPLYFDGRVDEMAMWSRLITPTEVTYLYNSGAARTCCNPLFYGP